MLGVLTGENLKGGCSSGCWVDVRCMFRGCGFLDVRWMLSECPVGFQWMWIWVDAATKYLTIVSALQDKGN